MPTGPGKGRQYGWSHGRPFLNLEAQAWRELVKQSLSDQARLGSTPIEVVLLHLSDGTGDDDIDHQLVPILDAITKCRWWPDDKWVERVTLARDWVEPEDLAAGVYVWAWERDGSNDS